MIWGGGLAMLSWKLNSSLLGIESSQSFLLQSKETWYLANQSILRITSKFSSLTQSSQLEVHYHPHQLCKTYKYGWQPLLY